MDRGWKCFEVHATNMDVKGKSDEVSDGNRNIFLETGGKVLQQKKVDLTMF